MLSRLNKSLYWLLVFCLLLVGCKNTAPVQAALAGTSDQKVATPAECKRIAFAMLQGENYDIFTACPDGSQLVNLTNAPGKDINPAWSPDGTKIVLSSDRSGSSQIYVMAADGSSPTAVTSDLENDTPIWLPDGHNIAFRTFDQHAVDYVWRILNLENSQLTTASKPFKSTELFTLAWSPDGESLAYTALLKIPNSDIGMQQIHVKNSDGSNDVALTADIWANFNPIWSPDGSKIAFLSGRDQVYGSYALYMMNKDGMAIKSLSKPILNEFTDYAWSPEGTEIAISSLYDKKGISIINLETGETRDFLPGDGGEKTPAWQP